MTEQNQEPVGVIAARFHVPELHTGHRFLIEEVCRRHQDVLIILGVAQSLPTPENPLSFEMREGMIRAAYPEREFTIVPSFASRKDYFQRSGEIDSIIRETFPGRPAVIYGSRKSVVHKYSGDFPTHEIETVYEGSGTEIRNGAQVINSPDFRAGVIYTVVHRPPVGRPAVDVALVDKASRQVILVEKTSEGEWRFPGAFFDADADQSYEDTALRVVRKELPTVTHGPLRMMGSKRIDDWRYRGSRDTAVSLLFCGETTSTTLRAGSGVDRATWANMDDLHRLLIPEHRPLAGLLN